MNDFEDDFDNFDDNSFEDFNERKSFKDTWQNSPLLKIFAIVAGIVLIIAAIMIFGGAGDPEQSRTGTGLNDREALGGEVTQNYQEVIDEVNDQRLEDAVRTGSSTIPMLTGGNETDLLNNPDELPPYDDFDPLATFRAAVEPKVEDPEPVIQEPQYVAPEQIFTPQAMQPQQQAPAANPEAIQALAQAMSNAAGQILGNHNPTAPLIMQVTPEDYYEQQAQLALAQQQDGQFDGLFNDDGTQIDPTTGEELVQTILIPAGTINYAQILIEANSDVPGPVLAQLMSGPLSGARLIGSFNVQEDVLVLNFNSIVVDGINQGVSAVAIDPNTTLPGIATEVNHRYWQRVILPAAARFLEGIGGAIAEDTQTTVTVSGDTVIQEQPALDFEQELGRGAEEGIGEIADFMDEEADRIQPLIRVARGTPVGVFFLEPVIEEGF